MGILADLKQTVDFIDKRDEVIVNIRFTNNYIIDNCQALFKQHNLTHQQYNILRILNGSSKPLSSTEVKERMIERMSDVSRLIDRLLAKELVSKTPSENDARKLDVQITEQGKVVLEEFNTISTDKMRDCINLTDQELSTLSLLLDKLRDNHAALSNK